MEEKSCINCSFYKQHYVKFGSYYFPLVGQGHCGRVYSATKVCEQWQEKPCKCVSDDYAIFEKLTSIEATLAALAAALIEKDK